MAGRTAVGARLRRLTSPRSWQRATGVLFVSLAFAVSISPRVSSSHAQASCTMVGGDLAPGLLVGPIQVPADPLGGESPPDTACSRALPRQRLHLELGSIVPTDRLGVVATALINPDELTQALRQIQADVAQVPALVVQARDDYRGATDRSASRSDDRPLAAAAPGQRDTPAAAQTNPVPPSEATTEAAMLAALAAVTAAPGADGAPGAEPATAVRRAEPAALPHPPTASPEQAAFIVAAAQAARASQQKTGVPASVTIAQAILESDWGISRLAREGNNLFGIKAQTRGGSAGVIWFNTWEVINGQNVVQHAAFRSYTSWADSFVDHGLFFHQNPRYHQALAVRGDPRQFAWEINRAGYATDPRYAPKLISLMDRFDLYAYDLK